MGDDRRVLGRGRLHGRGDHAPSDTSSSLTTARAPTEVGVRTRARRTRGVSG